MKSRPSRKRNRNRLLERFHAAADHGDQPRAMALLKQVESAANDADAAFARWRMHTNEDNLTAAVECLQKALERFADDPDLHRALGWTYLEMQLGESAATPLLRAVTIDPEFSDAWHDLALARELTGDLAGMRRAFAEVYALDTAEDLPDARFSASQVMKWADKAISALPDSVQAVIPDLPIFVQDYPDDWILDEPPWDPRLLGLFDGPTYAEIHGSEAGGVAPHVYLFQRNLERVCPGPREMAEQVRITLHHEVGHFLGLDEDELHRRGLG